MLTHPTRRRALELLHESGLLPIILPEAAAFHPEFPPDENSPSPDWQRTLRIVERLEQPSFPAALAALVRELVEPLAAGHFAEAICGRWRLSNAETQTVTRLIAHEAAIRRARELPWPQLQRVLVSDFVAELLTYGEAVARGGWQHGGDRLLPRQVAAPATRTGSAAAAHRRPLESRRHPARPGVSRTAGRGARCTIGMPDHQPSGSDFFCPRTLANGRGRSAIDSRSGGN